MNRFQFPAWINKIILPGLVVGGLGGVYFIWLVVYWYSPYTWDVGYAPDQPVPFSHKLHAGKLKLDCRYCHTNVEKSQHSTIPATSTCTNCHSPKINGSTRWVSVRSDSAKLTPIHESWKTGKSVPWVKVHDLPDYAYFNHSAHVTRGVSCVSCHGRVDQMDKVKKMKPLSMGWCLDCHRDPVRHLRPLDQITNLNWKPPADVSPEKFGRELAKKYGIFVAKDKPHQLNPLTQCSTCHR